MHDNFYVKKVYEELDKRRRNRSQAGRGLNVANLIWKSYAPFKAQVMGWRLVQNKLPTIDNLMKRFDIPAEEQLCCCCREEEESSRHLFFDCPEAQNLWQRMIQWCGSSWTTPRPISDHFESFTELIG